MQQTYRTKLIKSIEYGPYDVVTSYFNEYNEIFKKAERRLYVDIVHKKVPLNKLKSEYQRKFGINARQFNSIKSDLDGVINSKKELLKLELEEKEAKLTQFESKLLKLIEDKKTVFEKLSLLKMNDIMFDRVLKKYQGIKNSIHHLKRKILKYKHKIAKINTDLNNNIVRVCFGGKELFQKQFNLKENGFKSHLEWLSSWKAARNNQCFYLGSKDETFGNQNCQYNKDNTLKIKTAPILEKRYGKYIVIPNVYFKYGQQNIDYCKESYIHTTEICNTKKYHNGALSYRFIKNEFGLYLHVSADVSEAKIKTDSRIGGIGVDFNVNFVSVSFVDRFGNPIDELRLKYHMYGKTSNQIDAKLGDLCKELCDLALYYKVPIYIEDLCFAKAKNSIDKEPKYKRMINSFPYSKFRKFLEQRGKKYGAEVIAVNPSYTSIIGQFKFMKRYGLSSHGAAACTIARKGMKFKTEKLPLKYKKLVFINKLYINKSLNNYKMWIHLSSIIKKNMSFNDRIKTLYTS